MTSQQRPATGRSLPIGATLAPKTCFGCADLIDPRRQVGSRIGSPGIRGCCYHKPGGFMADGDLRAGSHGAEGIGDLADDRTGNVLAVNRHEREKSEG